MPRALSIVSLGLVVLPACAELPNRELGVCGNGLHEPKVGEYCDGTENCTDAEAEFACFHSCADEACPDGLVCTSDAVCKAQAFDFELKSTISTRPADWVDTQDLDGDGRPEILVLEPASGQDPAQFSVYALAADGSPLGSWSRKGPTRPPQTGDIDGDGLVDLLFDDQSSLLPYLNDGEGEFRIGIGAQAWRDRGLEIEGVFGWSKLGTLMYDHELHKVEGSNDDPVVGSSTEALSVPGAFASGSQPSLDEACPGNGGPGSGGGTVDFALIAGSLGYDLGVHAFLPGPYRVYSACEAEGAERVAELAVPHQNNQAYPSVNLVDVNLDGLDDLVAVIRTDTVHEFEANCEVRVAYGTKTQSFHSDPASAKDVSGDGQFSAEALFTVACDGDHRNFQFGHWDDDEEVDILITDVWTGGGMGGEWGLSADCGGERCQCELSNSPMGGDCQWLLLPALNGPPTVVDLNADGRDDLVFPGSPAEDAGAGGQGTVNIVYSTPSEDMLVPAEPAILTPAPVESIVVGHLDLDNALDVVALMTPEDDPQNAGLMLYSNFADPARPEGIPIADGVRFAGGPYGLGITPPQAPPGTVPSLSAVTFDEETGHSGIAQFSLGSLLSPLRFPLSSDDLNESRPGASWIDPNDPARFILLSIDESTMDGANLWHLDLRNTSPGVFALVTKLKAPLGEITPIDPTWAEQLEGVWAKLDADQDPSIVLVGPDGQDPNYPHRAIGLRHSPDGEDLTLRFGFSSNLVLYRTDLSHDLPGRAKLEALDIDGDGDEDLVAVAWSERGEGPRVAAIFEAEDGKIGDQQIVDIDDPDEGIRAFTFVASAEDPAARAAFVVADEIRVATFDATELSIDVQNTIKSEREINWSTSTDLDGDGLADLVFATEQGTVIYYGVPELPGEMSDEESD